ncbi:hypothetical protein B0H14DRAFT_3674026 [Mycena olivaceomarginata]|nr:hypothetical protein B0H14DRAFT_3674026 [Mycena olivaceomarginata]
MNAARVRADFRGKRKLRGEDGDGEEGDGQKKGKRGKIDGVGEDGQCGGKLTARGRVDGAGEDGDGQKKGKRGKINGAGDTQIRPGKMLAHFNNPPMAAGRNSCGAGGRNGRGENGDKRGGEAVGEGEGEGGGGGERAGAVVKGRRRRRWRGGGRLERRAHAVPKRNERGVDVDAHVGLAGTGEGVGSHSIQANVMQCNAMRWRIWDAEFRHGFGRAAGQAQSGSLARLCKRRKTSRRPHSGDGGGVIMVRQTVVILKRAGKHMDWLEPSIEVGLITREAGNRLPAPSAGVRHLAPVQILKTSGNCPLPHIPLKDETYKLASALSVYAVDAQWPMWALAWALSTVYVVNAQTPTQKLGEINRAIRVCEEILERAKSACARDHVELAERMHRLFDIKNSSPIDGKTSRLYNLEGMCRICEGNVRHLEQNTPVRKGREGKREVYLGEWASQAHIEIRRIMYRLHQLTIEAKRQCQSGENIRDCDEIRNALGSQASARRRRRLGQTLTTGNTTVSYEALESV